MYKYLCVVSIFQIRLFSELGWGDFERTTLVSMAATVPAYSYDYKLC
jgi:hypothetical protein